MSNLLKIPLIFLVTYGIHVSHVPPNKAPTSEHIPSKNFLEDLFTWTMIARQLLLKITIWSVGSVEAVAILMNRWESSRKIAHLLAGRARPTELALSLSSTLGFVIVFAGTFLRVWCYRAMASQFTFNITLRANHKLITTGPYSFVRHPSYAALLIQYVGAFIWYSSPGSWMMESGVLEYPMARLILGLLVLLRFVTIGALLARIPVEDAMLKNTFGNEWDDWDRKVPYALCPGIICDTKPRHANWKN